MYILWFSVNCTKDKKECRMVFACSCVNTVIIIAEKYVLKMKELGNK